MPRTTEAEVHLTIVTDLDEPAIEAFIADSNAWVTANLADAGLSEAQLTAVEKYLACHFVTLREPQLKSFTQDGIGESYQRHATVNEYLRMAMALDPTGKVEEAFAGGGGSGGARDRVQWAVGDGFAADE